MSFLLLLPLPPSLPPIRNPHNTVCIYNISCILLIYSFSSLVYSFYINAFNFLNMMCLYVLFVLYFDFGFNLLETKVFVFVCVLSVFMYISISLSRLCLTLPCPSPRLPSQYLTHPPALPSSLLSLSDLSFSPFAAVFQCGVAGLADTFPSFPVSGPFLPDVPRFQFPSHSIFPPQLWSSSRGFLSIVISKSAQMFSVSYLLLTCPNHSSLIITIAISSTFASSKIS